MKKIFSLALLLFAGAVATAQISAKDIEGKWKLITFDDDQAFIDAEKGTYKLKDDYKAMLSEEEAKEAEHDYSIMATQYKASTLTFTGNTATQTVGTEEYSGTYTLNHVDDVDEITIAGPDNTEDMAEISIKNKQLFIEVEGMVLVYKRADKK